MVPSLAQEEEERIRGAEHERLFRMKTLRPRTVLKLVCEDSPSEDGAEGVEEDGNQLPDGSQMIIRTKSLGKATFLVFLRSNC